MRRVLTLSALVLALLPAVAGADGPSPRQPQSTQQAQALGRRGWYKVVGGTLSASVGLGLFVAGRQEDPFTGDRSGGKTAAGLALAGGGAWLLWDGWKDIDRSRKAQSIAVLVYPRRAAIAYRRSW
jgi:hypothetical protein